MKAGSEVVSETSLRVSNTVIMDPKQDQITFGIGSPSKKATSTNSSVNVSFKYSKANSPQI